MKTTGQDSNELEGVTVAEFDALVAENESLRALLESWIALTPDLTIKAAFRSIAADIVTRTNAAPAAK